MGLPPSLRPRLEFAAKAFLVAAFLGSLSAGVLRLQQKALADPASHVDLGSWSVVAKPDWCTTDDVRALRDATRLAGWRGSLLHPGTGPVVWRSLACAPQVVRVAGLRNRPPNEIEAVVEIRRPVAVVRCGPASHPSWVEVDADGRALSEPLAAPPVRAGTTLRTIVGATGAAPRPGSRFGPDVAAAADLADALLDYGTDADRALLEPVAEIDVSNFRGRAKRGAPEFVLRAASGRARCDVEWGAAPSADPLDPEASFGAKAERLVRALRTFPGLDGLRSVKVAFDDLVVVPAAGSPLSRK